MIKLLFLALVLISMDVCGQKTNVEATVIGNHSNELKVKVKDLHLKKFRWLIDKQVDSLSYLLHDEVYYIHSNGWKETKDEVLQNIQSGKLAYTDIKVHESDVRILNKTALVTGKGTFYVNMEGKPYEFNLFYTEVYVITENGIKLLSRHACKY